MKPIGGPASGGPTGAACSVLRRETWQVRTRSTVYASIRVGVAFVLAGIVVGVLPAKGAAQAPTSPPPTPFFPWDDRGRPRSARRGRAFLVGDGAASGSPGGAALSDR